MAAGALGPPVKSPAVKRHSWDPEAATLARGVAEREHPEVVPSGVSRDRDALLPEKNREP